MSEIFFFQNPWNFVCHSTGCEGMKRSSIGHRLCVSVCEREREREREKASECVSECYEDESV